MKKEVKGSFAGFTLIEILVVLSIIALLSTIALTSLRSARRKAYDAAFQQTVSSIRNVALMCCDTGVSSIQELPLEHDSDDEIDICDDPNLVQGLYPNTLEKVDVDDNCFSGDWYWKIQVYSTNQGYIDHAHCEPQGCSYMMNPAD